MANRPDSNGGWIVIIYFLSQLNDDYTNTTRTIHKNFPRKVLNAKM